MKKVLSTVAIAFIALSVVFTSCRNDASTQGSETTTQPAETEAAPETQTSEAAPAADTLQGTADTTQAQ